MQTTQLQSYCQPLLAVRQLQTCMQEVSWVLAISIPAGFVPRDMGWEDFLKYGGLLSLMPLREMGANTGERGTRRIRCKKSILWWAMGDGSNFCTWEMNSLANASFSVHCLRKWGKQDYGCFAAWSTMSYEDILLLSPFLCVFWGACATLSCKRRWD